MKVLETTGLTKKYGNVRVVDSVNLAVETGQVYGFLGNNGAGKTTTIKMMLGLVKPDTGKVKFFGKDFDMGSQNVLKKVGAIVEIPGFYGNLNAFQNLKVFSRLKGISKANAIEESLSLVGLDAFDRKKVSKFSLGMKQRLGIARALLSNPEILILDEPTNGLDPSGIKEMRELFRRLAKDKNLAVFISSHILSEMELLADKVGILHQGVLVDEVDMNILKSSHNRYIEIKVDSLEKTVKILETKLSIFDYEVCENKEIKIYDKIDNPAGVNKTLVENGIGVQKLLVDSKSLESYFLEAVKGDMNV